MEELKLVEKPLMSEEEFEKYIKQPDIGGGLRLCTFEAVKRFRSVRRAYRRGLISDMGVIFPKRPFNNRKPTKGRKNNELKKAIYARCLGK